MVYNPCGPVRELLKLLRVLCTFLVALYYTLVRHKMPRHRATKRSRGRGRGRGRLPPMFRSKPANSITFGWQLALPASVTSGSFALDFNDLMFAVAMPTTSPVAQTATMTPIFQAVKLKSLDVWEENGLPISLTWGANQSAGFYVPGPDATVTDTGSAGIASHVKLVPKKGSIQENWYASNSTQALAILTLNGKLGTSGSGSVTPRLLLRAHIDYVLNDANAFTATITTTSVNTLFVASIYWRCLVTSSNTWYPEGYPGIATYLA